MRFTVTIDDALLEEAQQLTNLSTKRALIEEALRTLVRMRRQEDVRSFRGKLHWEGDLGEMRSS